MEDDLPLPSFREVFAFALQPHAGQRNKLMMMNGGMKYDHSVTQGGNSGNGEKIKEKI
jgi:hypothetical protein